MKYGLFSFLSIVVLTFVSCSENKPEKVQTQKNATPVNAALPGKLIKGEALFNTNCSPCHGEKAKGTEKGPPLVHKIYEPNHHSDASFYLAVQKGVRSHHWKFGDMPKLSGVKTEEVTEIIGYVRWLQQQAGIF